MTLNYGSAPDPGQYVIALLTPRGLPIGRTRNVVNTGLPCYMVTVIPGRSSKYMLCAEVRVHSFATDPNPERAHDIANANSQAADKILLSQTPADITTLANGTTAAGWICPSHPPSWQDYKDPLIIRYFASYHVELRFTASGSVT